MNKIILRYGIWGLDYDPDYGIDHRRGWTATHDGHVIASFVRLRVALLALARAWVEP